MANFPGLQRVNIIDGIHGNDWACFIGLDKQYN